MTRLSRLPLMLVSFLLSIMLWVYVQVLEHPETGAAHLFEVQIVAIHTPVGLIVLDRPSTFRALPQGSEDDIRKVNPDDLIAELDLSKAHKGIDSYPVRLRTLKSYNVTWEPKMVQVQVTIDVYANSVQKPVVVRTTGQLRDPNYQYVRENTTTDNAVVFVSGPQTIVDKVDHAQAILNLSNVSAGAEESHMARLELVDANGTPVTGKDLVFSPNDTAIRPAIALAAEMKPLLVSPNFRGSPAFGYRVKRYEVQPTQIEVKGRADALANMSAVPTLDVNIDGIKQTTTYQVKVRIPPQLTISGSAVVNITVVVEAVPPPPASPARTARG